MPCTVPQPGIPEHLSKDDVWRIDLALCAAEFRRGRLSEAGFRHHLTRLGFAAHELAAEVEHHRTELSEAA